jgi:hypothetical protein
MGEERKVYRVLLAKPEGKRPLQRHSWEDGIRMDLREIGWGSVDRIQLAHVFLVLSFHWAFQINIGLI